jgi:hypothetical protein
MNSEIKNNSKGGPEERALEDVISKAEKDLALYKETYPSSARNTVWMERRIKELKKLLDDIR